jgi:hypothetical protein
MKRNSSRPSGTRTAALASIGIALALSLFSFTDDSCARGVRGVVNALNCYNCDDRVAQFPIPKSEYDTTGGGTDFPTAPIPVELVSLRLAQPLLAGVLKPIPLPPDSVQYVGDVDMSADVVFGAGLGRTDTTNIKLKISNPNPPGNTGLPFDTEIMSLDITGMYPGSNGPIPFILRESPTLASLGQHSIAHAADGSFLIDSFFDVFTELSLDGGQTFYPARSSFELDLTGIPEPSSLVLAGLAAVGLAFFVQRRPTTAGIRSRAIRK